MFAQCAQVAVVAANGCQARRLDLDHPACLQGVLHRAARQHQHGFQRIGAGAHVGAVALADFQHAGEGQHAHRFAHGVAAHAEQLGEFRLRRQALAERPMAGVDALADLLQGDVHQGALEGNGHGRNIQSSDEFARRIPRQLQARKASLGEKALAWRRDAWRCVARSPMRQPTAAVSPARRDMPSCARRRSQGLGR